MRSIQNITNLVLLSIAALFIPLILAINAFADSDGSIDEVNITVPISCTLSGSGMTSHTTSIPNGTYTPDIGTTTLTAFCNDNSGFSIYAAGFTGDEIGATNSNKLVGTSATNYGTISTGTATGPVNNNDTSNWAMKLTAVSNPTPTYPITISTGFDSYHAVPNEYTKVATRLSGTDVGQSAEGSSLTTTYAAYISRTQPADVYTGQVKYVLVHPSYANIEGCNPSATSITDTICMQDISSTNKSSILSSMTTDQQYILKDKRDDTRYTVAKLQDGNVWMTQNLELGEYGTSMALTNQDSNVSSSGYTLTFEYANNSVYKGDSNKYGNYYNWAQATAGSGTTTSGENAPYDICPTGWRLPRTNGTPNASNEFRAMLNNYVTTGSWNDTRWTNVTLTEVTDAPVSLVLSGYITYSNGNLNSQGSRGTWWGDTSAGSITARTLEVYNNDNTIYPNSCGSPSSCDVRTYVSIRCLMPSS